MKTFAIVLLILLVLLQARLWLSDEGVREVTRLEGAVAEQKEENSTLRARNDRLAAEVKDLKEGLEAVEERARSDLGMVGSNESFYQVVPPEGTTTADAKGAPQTSQQASAR